MESVENDGEVGELFQPLEVVGSEEGNSKLYLDLDSLREESKNEISSDSLREESNNEISSDSLREESNKEISSDSLREESKNEISPDSLREEFNNEISSVSLKVESNNEISSGNNEISSDSLKVESNNEISPASEENTNNGDVVFSKTKLFVCLICGKKFNQNAGRYNHMKKIHNINHGEKTNIRCLEKGCSFRCSYKEKLQLHLVEEHGLSMDIRVNYFNSFSEFLRWKEEFEKQENTRFVKKSGSRPREEGVRVVYFYCSRSGTPICRTSIEKQNGKKRFTTKSNHHCTASITCIEKANGEVEVKVCATHYGHDNDLQRLRLTKTDKINIVEQLAKGLPRDVILDNIRSSTSSQVERINLITLKDVKNIEKSYRAKPKSTSGIPTNCTCSNINSWVSLMSESDHTPVVHFEEQASNNSADYDFTLVLMTVGQIEMAKKYGQSKIFYIPTYTTKDDKYVVYSRPNKTKNTHDIHLATLIVADSHNDAIPIAFVVSTNLSMEKFKLFFACVKTNVPELEAKAVLTDDRKEIFEAWNVVFTSDSGEEPCHLWSNRFVDKDWRDNLVNIPNEEIQESVYERLYSYLESPEEMSFRDLKDFVDFELLTNPLTFQFGNHFALKYLGSEAVWAGCYGKKSIAVHAQLNMERLSDEIEDIIDRKQLGLDKRFVVSTVQDLLKLFNDNQCHRQVKIQKQVQELPNHHILALQINPKAISKESELSWRVSSTKDPEKIFSIVTKQQENSCNSQPCVLFCNRCSTCAHKFSCSCRLYAFDKTMCKHIHAVIINFFDEVHFPEPKKEKSKSDEKATYLWGWHKKKKLNPPTERSQHFEQEEKNLSKTKDVTERRKNTRKITDKLPSKKSNKSSSKQSNKTILLASEETIPSKGTRSVIATPRTKEEENLLFYEDATEKAKFIEVETNISNKGDDSPPKLDATVVEDSQKKESEVKRKRGRPKKNTNRESEITANEKKVKVEDSKTPHRLKVNILKKCRKTQTRSPQKSCKK
ncbi:uncharacterized protein LOC128981960 [Macrosteles quadrilineatus]|uniref:uncharacterized protein LOC128981960 n=1 Tax=Macrosteles quadrilineatus TaxID=74068 RepID=UPI0023E1B074|nr:uncharacterized protein LOC128981960 [Macrosteles quadrilineatus]